MPSQCSSLKNILRDSESALKSASHGTGRQKASLIYYTLRCCIMSTNGKLHIFLFYLCGRSSVVRAFAHGAVGRRIDPSWGGPIELFLVPASAPRLV